MLSRFPRRADARLVVAVAVAAATLAVVAVAGSLGAVGRPFPGFVVWDDLVVVALGRPSWTGVRAGVPFRARVVAVDDVPVARRTDVDRLIEAAPIGAVHRYAFTGRDGDETREVASMRFRSGDWVVTMAPYVVNGLAFLLTGLAVFWLKPDSRQSRALLAFGTVWGLTLLLAVDLFTAGTLERLYFVCEALSPAAVLHLALVFPEPRVRRGWPIAVAYALGGAVGLVQAWAFWRDVPLLLAVNDAVYLALAATGVAALGAIGRAAVAASAPVARRRARVVLAGALAAFAIPLLALLAFFLLQQPMSFSLLALTGFLFPLSIGWAVARHDLFEADRFVKQAVVYAALTALVSLGWAGSVLVAERVAAGLALRDSPLFTIAFVLIALATLVPLRDRVQRAVDRLLYRSRVDYKTAVVRATERMGSLLERDAVGAQVTAVLHDVLFLEGVAVWEREAGDLVRRGQGTGRLAADHPGLAAFTALDRPLSRDEVDESPRLRQERAPLRGLFDALGATLLVPLVREGRAIGILTVGGKASGGPLSADDLDVLRTVASEAAVALGTAAAVAQLAETRARLAQAQRLAAIGELSAAVAHGIRNPLAGIRLAAQLGLESTPADAPVRENFEDVLAEVHKLEAQVRGILDFARPFEPQLEPIALRGLVEGLLDTLRPRLDASHVTAAVELRAGLPLVLADRAHLGQALQELVVNAIEAMPAGGTLAVRANRNGSGHVRVEVEDSGGGVTPAIRDRIFQLFMTTKSSGTGVGLAVARKIAERHGGTLALEEGAQGARFVLELPAAA